MVAKATVVESKHVDITFPPGESAIQIDLKPTQELTPWCIPSCVTELYIKGATALKPGVITEGITHLRVDTLTKDMHIPPTVKCLLIDSTNCILPSVPIENLFIHKINAHDKEDLPEHSIFYFAYSNPEQNKIDGVAGLKSSYEPIEDQKLVTMFGEQFWVLKSIKAPVVKPEPVPVPEVKIETPASVQLSEKKRAYLEAKRAYIEAKIAAI